MFPRRERISRKNFSHSLTGRRFSSPNFSLIVPHHGKGYAVVISKKTARLSVARHLLKRRVLAVLRSLPLPPALVVFPRPPATRLTFKEIKEELAVLAKDISR